MINLQEQLVQFRRQLHQNPELSMEEYQTTENIKSWLSQAGIPVLDIPGMNVGVVAEVRGKYSGQTIALRADIDALPIEEMSGAEFSSKTPGVMHACGHDFHTSVMIGAAMLLNQRKDLLHGRVRFLFQSSEENAQGAKWMANFGVLDGVSAIFGCHNRPDLPVGTVGIKEGPLMACVSRFDIEITGKGGHAGMPENCIDPIVIGSQVVMALQTIVSRRLSPLDNAAVSITRFSAGNTWNVIPFKSEISGTIRTLQPEVGKNIVKLMQQMSEGIGCANGANIAFHWTDCLPPVKNDPQLTDLVTRAAKEECMAVVPARPNLGGEDFAYLQNIVPGYFIWLGVDGPKDWHHPAFTIDERALEAGARYFSRLGQLALNGSEKSPEISVH